MVDIIPVNQSGEANQNSQPSLGVAVGTNYGEMVVHAFTPTNLNNYYHQPGFWRSALDQLRAGARSGFYFGLEHGGHLLHGLAI